jgi:hypothetical protein
MEWTEPTNPVGGKAKYGPAFDTLKQRPREWAKIATGLSTRTQLYRLRQQYSPDYEVVTEPEDGGKWAIYARYNPAHYLRAVPKGDQQ